MINKEKFKKIVDLAYELEKLGADVFIMYYGHVNGIDIQVYSKGWKMGTRPDYHNECYFDDEKLNLNCENIDNSIIFLTGLLNLKKREFQFSE